MNEESTTPDLAEVEAVLRTAFADGIDFAQVVHDDAAWAAHCGALAAIVDPEFVYEDGVLPDHAVDYRGFDGLRRAIATYVEPFEEVIYHVERIVGFRDRVVSIHRVRATGRQTGISLDAQVAYVWSFRGTRVVHVQGFFDPDAALKAAGLETPDADHGE